MIDLVKKYYIVGIIGIIVLILIAFTVFPGKEPNENIVFNPTSVIEEEVEEKYIYIDIKGEVMNPGVYKVLDTTRLFQLIALAGGITIDADPLALNYSKKLKDEQVIYIPSITDEYPNIAELEEEIINELIDINRASLEQLDTLPGIGPSTAQSIIDFRDQNGDFETVEDLIEVPGIGEATMNEIRELITT